MGAEFDMGAFQIWDCEVFRKDYAMEVSLLREISYSPTSHQDLSQWRGESPR